MNLNVVNPTTTNRTLLSNSTACHVLGNIATMQFFYPGLNYAFTLYRTYIWQVVEQRWGTSQLP